MNERKVTTKVPLVGGYRPSWARTLSSNWDDVVDMLIPARSYCEVWAERVDEDGDTLYDLVAVIGGDRIVVKGVLEAAFEWESQQ